MKRRTFLKSTAGATAAAMLPALTMESLLNPAYAVPAYNELSFTAPAVLPQVINVFLYGGASELAGNLTNIVDIDANSQNPYPDTLVDRAKIGGDDPRHYGIMRVGSLTTLDGISRKGRTCSIDYSDCCVARPSWRVRSHRAPKIRSLSIAKVPSFA